MKSEEQIIFGCNGLHSKSLELGPQQIPYFGSDDPVSWRMSAAELSALVQNLLPALLLLLFWDPKQSKQELRV